jgi:hypothetical protein
MVKISTRKFNVSWKSIIHDYISQVFQDSEGSVLQTYYILEYSKNGQKSFHLDQASHEKIIWLGREAVQYSSVSHHKFNLTLYPCSTSSCLLWPVNQKRTGQVSSSFVLEHALSPRGLQEWKTQSQVGIGMKCTKYHCKEVFTEPYILQICKIDYISYFQSVRTEILCII